MASRVLVIDDEAMIRDSFKAYLEDEGLPTDAVASGEAALALLHTGGGWAVCIVDIHLPGMDGDEVIRALQADCPDLRFLIHTGLTSYSLPADLTALRPPVAIYRKPLDDMAPLAAAVRVLAQRGMAHDD